MNKTVAFTTSFPVEVIFAANLKPIDLNNIFITNKPQKQVEQAEDAGFPRNLCSWIKGMHTSALKVKPDYLVGIVQGDCSNTHSLMENLDTEGINIVPFSYPFKPNDYDFLNREIEKLESIFNVSRKQVNNVKSKLDEIRKKLIVLDELTYIENKVTGAENHFWLVNSSDFCGDFVKFEKDLDEFIYIAKQRPELSFDKRFAYLGVPPIFEDLYVFLLENNANIVFNEVQRQFAMPYLETDIVSQYLKFTYPYSVKYRLNDIKLELQKRKIDGVINYSQSFCHRQLDFLLIKKQINLPIINLEGDNPSSLDARSRLRLESFIDMLDF